MTAYQSQEVSIEGKVTLSGTLTIPSSDKEVFPSILIIPGTGTLDRDGNAKRGKLQLNLYKELAEFLTSIGFATLRYDKRGVGKSGGKTVQTGMYDLVDDAEAAVEFLRRHPRVDRERVIVLGHSEGTILATALNARNPVSGLILLSGAGATLDEAIKDQQRLAFSEMECLKGLKGFLIKKLKVAEKSKRKNAKFFNDVVNTDKDIMRINGFMRISSKWFREHFTYNLFEDYKKIKCPVLAITGKKDFQADYKALDVLPKYIKSPLAIYAIDDMNHGLKVQKNDVSILEAKKLYVQDIGKELHPMLKSNIADWLTENFKQID